MARAVWVLDRPNPAGRPVEGLTLRPGWESFVGAGPMPMRHGLTLGELGHWFVDHFKLDVDYRVIEMEGWRPDDGAGLRLAARERIWINPSPNAANLNMARAYAGTVMLEGTTLSEGRGTTRPLELFGAPDIERARGDRGDGAPGAAVAGRLQAARHLVRADLPQACRQAVQRRASSTPKGRSTIMQAFKPWRLQALAFKAIRRLYPDYPLWRDFPYEYVFGKLAIDVINGSPAAARMGRRLRPPRPATSTR